MNYNTLVKDFFNSLSECTAVVTSSNSNIAPFICKQVHVGLEQDKGVPVNLTSQSNERTELYIKSLKKSDIDSTGYVLNIPRTELQMHFICNNGMVNIKTVFDNLIVTYQEQFGIFINDSLS